MYFKDICSFNFLNFACLLLDNSNLLAKWLRSVRLRLNDYEESGQRSAVSEHDGRVFCWLCQLEIISCFFSRKSYFFFYKLNKQVTNNVFKKRKTKGNGGRRFWGFCTPSVEFNKWRPERNERNSSQDSKRHSLMLSKLPKCFISWWTHSWLFYNIFNPMVCWFDLFADVMSVHNRNIKHAHAIEFDST